MMTRVKTELIVGHAGTFLSVHRRQINQYEHYGNVLYWPSTAAAMNSAIINSFLALLTPGEILDETLPNGPQTVLRPPA